MVYFQDKVFPYPEPTDDQQETLQMMIDPVERFFTEKGREIKGSIKKLYTNIDESLQRDCFPSPRLPNMLTWTSRNHQLCLFYAILHTK